MPRDYRARSARRTEPLHRSDCFDHMLAVGFKLFTGDRHAEFPAFQRLFQHGDQILQVFPRFAELRHFNNDFRHQVGAVIEKIIFPQRRMAGGFNGERRVNPLCGKPLRLIDHIFITALKTVMFPAKISFNKGFQPAGGD